MFFLLYGLAKGTNITRSFDTVYITIICTNNCFYKAFLYSYINWTQSIGWFNIQKKKIITFPLVKYLINDI